MIFSKQTHLAIVSHLISLVSDFPKESPSRSDQARSQKNLEPWGGSPLGVGWFAPSFSAFLMDVSVLWTIPLLKFGLLLLEMAIPAIDMAMNADTLFGTLHEKTTGEIS